MDTQHFIGMVLGRATVLLSNAPKSVRKLIARALLELLDRTGGRALTLFAWAAYAAEFEGGANV
jgi:hypothetical protein